MKRISIVREFLLFLKQEKIWWMAPIIFFLLLLGFIVVVAETSALGPFIYTLF